MNESELKQILKEYSEKLLRNAEHREWMSTLDPKSVLYTPEQFEAMANSLRLAEQLLVEAFANKGIVFK